MRTTVQLPDNLLKAAKKRAAEDGRTLTSLIEEGLRHVIAKKHTSQPIPRKLPRVSKSCGGLKPGIDPVKISTTTQQTEDDEMLARVARNLSGVE